MLTRDRKFEVDVISVDGSEQFRLRILTPKGGDKHPHTWLGNFTAASTDRMFALISYYGGDPATLKEVDNDDRIPLYQRS